MHYEKNSIKLLSINGGIMRKIINEIIRKYNNFKSRRIDEANTKRIFIEPILKSLGWDTSNIDEVEEEAPVFGGENVDYSLKINKKPKIYIEAKALKKTIDVNKFISQAVTYAFKDGVIWCILTNGMDYKIYKSDEKGAISDKLLIEFSLKKIIDNPEKMYEIIDDLKLLSKENIIKGSLLNKANYVFIDSKVKKVLENLKRNPSRKFINIIRDELNREYKTKEIKDSILRIAGIAKPEGYEKPIGYPAPKGIVHWISSIKADELRTTEEMIQDHIGRYRVYAFGVRTPGRKSIKPGDWICFYATNKGVIAHARVISKPEKKRHPSIRHPEKYPYVFNVDSEKLYLDNPIIINSVTRKKLDAFQGRDLNRSWGWFVQSTRPINKHDFEILTGNK